jgi:uncharacterized phage protein (TIGR01671 family)
MGRIIKFEYGFESVNGVVKKVYHLHEIPNMAQICDVWNMLPIKYVRQFTGASDKNGKEIYEGDILANENRDNEDNVYVCEYISKEARYYFTSPFDGEILDENDIVEELVIIGNIHENPELC